MGYFDGLTDAAFKKSTSGNNLFYPWGLFGSGVVIESEETHTEIRKFLKKVSMVTLFAVITIQVTVGFWLNVALLPIFGIWYHFTIKKITKDLPRTTEKLRFSESYKNSAKSHNLATLILLEVFSIGFVAMGVWMLSIGGDQLMAMSSIGFFGFCSIAIGYMIHAKIRQRRV